MQLRQQGRILAANGAALNGPQDVAFEIIDGSDSVLFTSSYPTLNVVDGYYAVDLGSGVNLDTSVFLDHGATHLRISVDGVALSTSPLGGYPAVVAHQAGVDARLDAMSELFAPTTCAAGMTLVNPAGSEKAFCIETAERSGLRYQPAEATCAADGLHLCTQTEWYEAATQIGSGFCGLGHWSWVATLGERGAADGDLHLIVGHYSDCEHYQWEWTGYSNNQSAPLNYRCCKGHLASQYR